MKTLLKMIVTSLLVLGLISCASMDYVQGTKVSDEQMSKFIKGKTTKDEVVAELGGPQDFKLEDGKKILTYKYQKIGAFSKNEGFDTIFIFNKKGILEEIMKSQKSSLTNPLT